MKTKYFYPNKEGDITFTREELEKLLNDVYDEGREAGKREVQPYIINIGNTPEPAPYIPTIIYNTPPAPSVPTWGWTKVYCTDDNSIGRITIDYDTINTNTIM